MCRNHRVSFLAVMTVFACALGAAQSAGAQTPQEVRIRYNIRDLPGEPLSPVTWTIDLALQEADAAGNSIGWAVNSVTICKLDASGQPENTWLDAAPVVTSADGLWWVQHADPENPARSEFVLPPCIGGTAAAHNPANANMNYYLEGVPYDPSPGTAPFLITAALNYSLHLDGDPLPTDGDDEPVELPPDGGPVVGFRQLSPGDAGWPSPTVI